VDNECPGGLLDRDAVIHGELQLRQIHGEEKAARRQSRSGGQGWKGMVEEGAGLTPDACSLPVFLLNHTKFLLRVERQGNTCMMMPPDA
jgi:hypothetical protein